METITETTIAPGDGWQGDVDKGCVLRITGQSVLEFIAFKRGDPREFFDVARTRVYNLNIYPTAGHRLFSKQNNPMMHMRADGFAGTGRHDLQFPGGCTDRMLTLLNPLDMAPTDLPDPLALFRNLDIAPDGKIAYAPLGPPQPAAIELEAEIDLLCAIVNCPDPKSSASAAPATVAVLKP